MHKEIEELRFCLMDSRKPDRRMANAYNQAFSLWKSVWAATYLELEGKNQFFSDGFLLSDRVSALYMGEKAIAVLLYTFFSLDKPSHRESRYLKSFPELALSRLKKEGIKDVLSLGHLAIDPEYRKRCFEPPISEIIVGLACKAFAESAADAVVAYTHNERKVNECIYGFGAKPLLKNQFKHNVPVDYIYLAKDSLVESPNPEAERIIKRLWELNSGDTDMVLAA